MSKFRRRAITALVIAFSVVPAGGMMPGAQSAGEAALAPARQPASPGIEARVNVLLAQMTLQEKLEQIQLLPDFLVTDQEVQKGLGSVLSVTDPVRINQLQHIAVEQSRLHIPMLFALDTIHGFRTVFPIPLATASPFDPQVAADDHRIG